LPETVHEYGMAQMIVDNQIESYSFPQGVLSQMYSTVAARKPGVFTKVGLHTYIDAGSRAAE
jgi:propionate CoA-transferase